jgi:hypothetical protein
MKILISNSNTFKKNLLRLAKFYHLTEFDSRSLFKPVIRIATDESFQKSIIDNAIENFLLDNPQEYSNELELGFNSAITGYVYAHSYHMQKMNLFDCLENGCAKIHSMWCDRTSKNSENSHLFVPYALLSSKDKTKDRVFLIYLINSIQEQI